MKKIKAWYWIITIIFSLFMISTSIPDILMSEDAVKFMRSLGYPDYFMPFIGVAKILGSIAILIPGFPRIAEWAYAGLMFDLIGATYSQVAVMGFQTPMLFMVLPFTFAILSYWLYHRKLQLSN